MTSIEKYRSSAYSDDLRWRIIWQREGLRYSCQQIADNLHVDKSTVSRITARFLASGTVSKTKYPKHRAYRKITLPVQLLIFQLVIPKPGIYLEEIQDEIENVLMMSTAKSTICRFLYSSGFSRQKLQLAASQQDVLRRQQYVSDLSVYSSEMFVFIDETGADRRNTLRKYGYSLRGKPIRNYNLRMRGERISAITCISMAGVLDVMTVHGTTDGSTFYKFIQTHLLPHLMPFNGSNPHSVVVMDNCAIHHVDSIVSSINDVGAIVHFLPPYSPDYQPIEETFSKVKSYLQHGSDSNIVDIETELLASFTNVTQEDCQGWICHSGIYN